MKNTLFKPNILFITLVIVILGLVILLTSCVKKTDNTDNTQPKRIYIKETVHSTANSTMYIGVFRISNVYTSHVVWVEDTNGNITHVSTH